MRTLTAISFVLLITAPNLVRDTSAESTVQAGRAVLEECSAYSQAGIRECLAKKVNESATSLKQAENEAQTAVSRWDEDARYIVVAERKLKASTKAFAAYRKAQCVFAAALGGGAAGNALEIGRLACVYELNIVRAGQLRSAVASLPKK